MSERWPRRRSRTIKGALNALGAALVISGAPAQVDAEPREAVHAEAVVPAQVEKAPPPQFARRAYYSFVVEPPKDPQTYSQAEIREAFDAWVIESQKMLSELREYGTKTQRDVEHDFLFARSIGSQVAFISGRLMKSDMFSVFSEKVKSAEADQYALTLMQQTAEIAFQQKDLLIELATSIQPEIAHEAQMALRRLTTYGVTFAPETDEDGASTREKIVDMAQELEVRSRDARLLGGQESKALGALLTYMGNESAARLLAHQIASGTVELNEPLEELLFDEANISVAPQEAGKWIARGAELFTRSVLPLYRLDPDVYLPYWRQFRMYGNITDLALGSQIAAMAESIRTIVEVESRVPGGTRALTVDYGIVHFGRYPTELLIDQLRSREKVTSPYVAVVTAHGDHNGTFSYQSRIDKTYESAKNVGIPVRVAEAESWHDVLTRLDHVVQVAGRKVPIAIIGGHGNQSELQLDMRFQLQNSLTPESFGVGKNRTSLILEPDALLFLNSCSTGVGERPIAYTMSNGAVGTVVAPNMNIVNFYLTFAKTDDGRTVVRNHYVPDTAASVSFTHGKRGESSNGFELPVPK